jgi:RNA polymerase sigma factor (sigma-70 family)
VDVRPGSVKAGLPEAPEADVAGWYRQYHKRLLKYLRGSLRTESDAQDLSQEVFLRLLRLPEERVIEHPRAYLFRVAANVLSDWHAGQKAFHALPHEDPDSLPSSDRTDDEYDRRRRQEQIRRRVAALPVHQRTALLLSAQHGMTYSEIAATLGVSERRVKRYIVKAYASLRRDLAGLVVEGSRP